ncbi:MULTISPECIES: YidB family protein [Bradyrhizobium]|uniref:YidB family protein n=1 Tax=Bradyrhizobium TaxID=374 RepID=UPI0006840D42|nr:MULTISPECIES: YidB family protein [Bradyrhizobium]UFW51106.1 YidB family protein [Bradyrhizobium arachidis]
MRPFDNFGSVFIGLAGQVAASGLPELLGAALKKSSIGDLQTVVDRLTSSGFADRVFSWAENQPKPSISPNEVAQALGPDNVASLADSLGVPKESALNLLADKLPAAIGEATKHGDITVGRIRATG